jgi:hypothetical protein
MYSHHHLLELAFRSPTKFNRVHWTDCNCGLRYLPSDEGSEYPLRRGVHVRLYSLLARCDDKCASQCERDI